MFSTNDGEKFVFEEGDKYIHFTKYGGVNKGIVKHCGVVNYMDTNNGVTYQKPYIVNENNVHYDLAGDDGRFYRVTKEHTKEECEQMVLAYKKMMELKNNRKQEVMRKFKKMADKSPNDNSLDSIIKNKFNEDNIS